MIHRAKDLSPDQKVLIEGLLGRTVSEEDAISIRMMDARPAPGWLQNSWASAKRSALDQLSMEDIEAEISAARKDRRG